MQVLTIILNIVIFLLCLSFVVCIHEAGHLSMAKLFNVYCFEYSIGFGPALFHKRLKHKVKKGSVPVYTATTAVTPAPSANDSVAAVTVAPQAEDPQKAALLAKLNDSDSKAKAMEQASQKPVKAKKENSKYDYVEGETYLSIRALPLGGYVSMAGEDGDENPEGIKVPKERTLPGVSHIKQIIIMLAGIVMNFILAIILFFADYAFCPQKKNVYNTNAVEVSEKLDSSTDDPAYVAGLRSGDKILTLYQIYNGLLDNNDSTKTYDGVEFPSAANRVTITQYVNEDAQTADDYAHDSIAYAIQDVIAHNQSDGLTDIAGFENMQAGENSTRVIHLTYQPKDTTETKTLSDVTLKTSKNSSGVWTFGKFGISVMTTEFHYSAGEAFVKANQTWGGLFVSIYKALGSIFTPTGWKNVGGIISVYRVSAEGVASQSAGYFILLWGYISLNLGCFNLLPFPGLDGWQTLIALAEGISRKKFSTKFKAIANTVGLVILMAFAVVLIVKDILFPVV